MIGFYDYTVILTYISFISAVAGIFSASTMHLRWAIFFLAFSGLCDMFDGKIARKYNLVTNFGKFMDPLADKLLVSAAMIALIELERIPAWIVIVIISREFIISGFRLVAADDRGHSAT